MKNLIIKERDPILAAQTGELIRRRVRENCVSRSATLPGMTPMTEESLVAVCDAAVAMKEAIHALSHEHLNGLAAKLVDAKSELTLHGCIGAAELAVLGEVIFNITAEGIAEIAAHRAVEMVEADPSMAAEMDRRIAAATDDRKGQGSMAIAALLAMLTRGQR